MHSVTIAFAGNAVEALVLAKTRNGLRVAIPGKKDVSELQYDGHVWRCDGEAVDIDVLLSDEGHALKEFLYGERVRTAGQ